MSAGVDVSIVTGTNGKSTTSRLLTVALSGAGPVANNGGGSNMENGAVHAFALRPDSRFAVLEIDEPYVPSIAQQTRPKVIVLLNLSRESTRGVVLRELQDRFTGFFASIDWPCALVANADDPIVVSTIPEKATVIWVEEPEPWIDDTRSCPRCYAPLHRDGRLWWCDSCGLKRPQPHWRIRGGELEGPGISEPMALRMPGEWIRSNALFAIAAASAAGVDPLAGLERILDVEEVDGRYGVHMMNGHQVRLIMIKNAASWWSSLSVGERDGAVVLAMEPFGVKDLAPVWEVDVSALQGRFVVASGQRRLDVAARLEVAGIDCQVIEDHFDAIAACPPGPVYLIANYTAFLDLRRALP
jgi:UDP-N-acetylmuramyl tripeptide synthase